MERPANLLPWAAAISIAALASTLAVTVFRHQTGTLSAIQETYLYAVLACAAAGVPAALWYRRELGLATAVTVAIVLALFALAAKGCADFNRLGGEAQGWVLAIAFTYGLVFLALAIPVILGAGLVALAAGWLVLRLSGEFRAAAAGRSVFDLPRPGLRAAILLVLTVGPFSVYAFQTEWTVKQAYDVVDKDCRPSASPSLPEFKVDMEVDVDRPDWPRLRQVVEAYGAAHGLRLVPGNHLGAVPAGGPRDFRLCRPKKLMFLFLFKNDEPGISSFEPTGDSYFQLSIYAADREEWRKPMTDLVAEILATWPGTRFSTRMDLRPLVTPIRPNSYQLCRTRPMKQEYRACLPEGTAVRKETVYLQGETKDTPRLQRVLMDFGAAHQMAFTAPGAWQGQPAVPLGTNLCGGGALLVANPPAPTRGPPRAAGQPQPWRMAIATYVRTDDPGAQAILDAFIARLESEWPGIVRSGADIDFCRAMQGGR